MKTKDLKILKKFFDPASDAYLILAKKKNKQTGKPYVLGWQSRHKNELVHCKSYKKHDKVKKAFNEAANDRPEEHKHFTADPQQFRLYDWEDTFLKKKEHNITKKQAKTLIREVAKDYGIKTPSLKWKKKKDNYSSYDPEDHKVEMGHRDKITVLHEMAHAIECSYSDNEHEIYSYHSPVFAWIAIELYNRYAGINIAWLVTSAHNAGLLGDLEADQFLEEKSFARLKPQKHYRP